MQEEMKGGREEGKEVGNREGRKRERRKKGRREQESHTWVTPDLDIEKLFNITLSTIS